MKPNCEHCGDTGRLAGSSYFDCAKCGVAIERAELACFIGDFCENYSGPAELLPEDLNYAIHQRSRKKFAPINMLTVKIDAEEAVKWLREVLASDESTRAELIAAGWTPPVGDTPTRKQAIDAAAHAIHVADAAGLVLTVSQVPRQPLAMGNYSTRVEVRGKLER